MKDNLEKELAQRKVKASQGLLAINENQPSQNVPTTLHATETTFDQNPKIFENCQNSTQLPTWKDYFDVNEKVLLYSDMLEFNTYYKLPSKNDQRSIPIFFFHHGAGSSGLTFAPLCKELNSQLDGNCGLFTFDARGHGQTKSLQATVIDYDILSFTQDFKLLIEMFIRRNLTNYEHNQLCFIFVGHSLGGSICTSLFQELDDSVKEKIVGISMIDIIEKAAILSLKNIEHFLISTPTFFNNVDDAINWHLHNGLLKNRSSAEISIPTLFKTTEIGRIKRITDLGEFKPYWSKWFTNLSSRFVSLPTSKLLILAGNENIDKELIIGQMQGKYQLVVLQDSGHFVQEDEPIKIAVILIDFWKRNDRTVVIKTNWVKHKK